MASRSIQTAALLAGIVVALVFVKLMYDMSGSMSEMTGYVQVMSRDLVEMRSSMTEMSHSMQRMEQSMQGIGRAITQGSQQFQQWNPAEMMQQAVPGGAPRTR